MIAYDINGTPVTFGEGNGEITVKRNDPNMVNDFLNVAKTYLGKTSIQYKDGDTIFYTNQSTNGIDCSTYAGLCLMGYTFEQTPYSTGVFVNPDTWVGNDEKIWSLSTLKYKVSRFIDGSNPDEKIHLACQFARWMSDRNQVVPLGNGFRDVMPGDVVFWAAKDKTTKDWLHPTWYRHISHIGFVLSKEDAPDTFVVDGTTYTWDKTKYPFKHVIIEVYDGGAGVAPCQTNRYLEIRQEDPTNVYYSNVNTIAMIGRPDFGALRELANI